MTVTCLSDLLERASRDRDTDPTLPTLYIVGKVSRSIEIDGTVIERIGQVDCLPAYEFAARSFKVNDDGSITFIDDHPDWLDAGNDEETQIDSEDLDLVIVANKPSTFKTDEDVENMLVYPDMK